VLHKAVVPTQ